MRPEDLAYANLCLAVWEAGWRLWRERFAEMAAALPFAPGGAPTATLGDA